MLLIALGFFWRRQARYPALLVGVLWYCITLLPVSGIAQIASYAYADRYSYLPHIGFLIVLAWGLPIPATSRVRQRALFGLCLVMAATVALAHWQASHWKTSATLYARALAIDGGNRLARLALSHTHVRNGAYDLALQTVQPLLQEAGGPINAQAQLLVGDIHYFHGRKELAENAWLTAAAADSKYWRPHLRLGTLALENGHPQGAIAAFREADRLKPNHPDVLNNLGVAFVRIGDDARALDSYLRARNASRLNQVTLLNLARSYEKAGERAEAQRYYADLLRLNPGHETARAGLERTR